MLTFATGGLLAVYPWSNLKCFKRSLSY